MPEAADWYNSTYLMVWGSNVPQTRTPDAHFYTEVRYKGTKTVAVSSDFGEMVKFGDIWLAPKQGTDAALAMAMGHVILKEFHLSGASAYFRDYVRRYTDMPMLVPVSYTHLDVYKRQAWHLGQCLAAMPRGLDAALGAFTAIRQPKTAGLTELARVHARGLFERDAEVCRLRDQQVRAADPAAALRTLASAWGEGL